MQNTIDREVKMRATQLSNGKSTNRLNLWLAIGTTILLTSSLVACSSEVDPDEGPPPVVGAAVEGLAALVPDSIKNRGTLIIGSSIDFAPLEFYPEDSQEPTGFEIDLGNAMGAILDLEVEWINASFDGLLTGVAANRYDIALSGLVDIPERQEQVWLVDYALASNGVAASAVDEQAPTAAADLCGKTAGVQRGSSAVLDAEDITEDCAARGLPGLVAQEFQNQNQVLLALQTGRVDVAIGGTVWLEYVSAQSPGVFTVLPDKLSPVPFGMAISRDNTELAQVAALAVQYLIDSGEYQKIIEAWQLPGLAIERVSVNDGSVDLEEFLSEGSVK